MRLLRRLNYFLVRKYYSAKFPDIARIKRDANGMLRVETYAKLYQEVYELPDMDILEVGGASGAGSIVIAKAMVDSKKKSHLVVVEKCSGGSRETFGSYDDNLQVIKKNFVHFGVADQIRLFPEELRFDNADQVKELIKSNQIAALIHDADGRLDRDIHLFYDRLMPGGLVVVDDYMEKYDFSEVSKSLPFGGAKSLVTFRLMSYFIGLGYIQNISTVGATAFGAKPEIRPDTSHDLKQCKQILEQVFKERDKALGH